MFAVNTHMHADHITGTGKLKKLFPKCLSMISLSSGAKADVLLNPCDKIKFGRHELMAMPTPGHTNGIPTAVYFHRFIPFSKTITLIRYS